MLPYRLKEQKEQALKVQAGYNPFARQVRHSDVLLDDVILSCTFPGLVFASFLSDSNTSASR